MMTVLENTIEKLKEWRRKNWYGVYGNCERGAFDDALRILEEYNEKCKTGEMNYTGKTPIYGVERETILFEANDIMQTILEFVGTDSYKKMMYSSEHKTVETTFNSAMMLCPSIIMANCKKVYVKPIEKAEEKDAEDNREAQ